MVTPSFVYLFDSFQPSGINIPVVSLMLKMEYVLVKPVAAIGSIITAIITISYSPISLKSHIFKNFIVKKRRRVSLYFYS